MNKVAHNRQGRLWMPLSALILLLFGQTLLAQTPPLDLGEARTYESSSGELVNVNFFPCKDAECKGAVIDVVSGDWVSDEKQLEIQVKSHLYTELLESFDVYAIRPGSRGKATIEQMRCNLQQGVRYVRAELRKADKTDWVGIVGSSSGGQLAALVALEPKEALENASDPLQSSAAKVDACGLFFPVTCLTDFLDGQQEKDYAALLYRPDESGREDVHERIYAVSPSARPILEANRVPLVIYHGEADTIIPLQHSKTFVSRLNEEGWGARLLIKPLGSHPWPTIRDEFVHLREWFVEQSTLKSQD
jgi:pimeloyl-ACP methyl ester carboxylesterase